jgi:hypothetical protein
VPLGKTKQVKKPGVGETQTRDLEHDEEAEGYNKLEDYEDMQLVKNSAADVENSEVAKIIELGWTVALGVTNHLSLRRPRHNVVCGSKHKTLHS